MRRVFSAAALALYPALLSAGQSVRPPVLRSNVEVVDVAVVVRDADGRLLTDLSAADFEIAERGQRQSITAFDRVSIPVLKTGRGDARMVPSDVSSNEGLAADRIFAILLDGLHVSPSSLPGLRRRAQQFIEEYAGPTDLVAVLSPGAVDGATQDFTSDKARLLGAIDRFSGTKLRSATVELEEERQLAVLSGQMIHGGKDPSDSERADRAQSLASTLEAVAHHLARIDRRRKAVLLFSEGIDYNITDVMGGVQQHASEVRRAMRQAVEAMLRANVSLYAIDPRALGSAGAANDGRTPDISAPNVPRADGSVPRLDFSEPSLEQEYSASLQSLRNVAESTGGFAAVSSNDARAAFQRILQESSDYYVLGYTPASRGRPGEFRPITVRVSRPGARVFARSGYVVAAPQRAAARVDPPPDPPSVASGKRAGKVEFSPSEPPAAPSGLPGELATLLSSPLPAPGLTLRLQAIPFKQGEKKPLVQVVLEVLGSRLAFVERAGRFESRLELASLTIDPSGRAGNGRSTTLDLRLTPDEISRVKATGIRWITQLELAPGRYQFRVACRAPATGAAGMVTADVEVPSFRGARSLSGVTLTSLPSVLMVTRGQSKLAAALGTPPTAARTFVAGDRIVAAVEAYVSSPQAPAGSVAIDVERISGQVLSHQNHDLPADGGRSGASTIAAAVDTSRLSPGRYVLRIHFAGAEQGEDAERRVPFEVVANARN